MGFEHVGFVANCANATFTVVPDIDTFVSIKWNTSSLLNQDDLDGRDISARTMDHPSVDGIADSAILFRVSLLGPQEESLILFEDVDRLDAAFDLFPWLEEEAARASQEDLLSKLVVSLLILRVQDVTELIILQHSDVILLDELFIDVDDVSGGHLVGDEPLLTSLAFNAIDINKGLLSLKQECIGIFDDDGLIEVSDTLVNPWNVEPNISDQPLFSCLSYLALGIFSLAESCHLESLLGLDCVGLLQVDNLDLNSRGVNLGSKLKPFITSHALNIIICEISESLKLQSAISGDHRHLLFLHKALTGVEREGLGVVQRSSDLAISNLDLDLAVLIIDEGLI